MSMRIEQLAYDRIVYLGPAFVCVFTLVDE